ncbi:MAG: hypothetical protein KAW89_03195 [Armatimonadetes bacterium]|nr:hypothetical protein [Armatimonadota bacterium]
MHRNPAELRKSVLVGIMFLYREPDSGHIREEEPGTNIPQADFGGAVVAVTRKLLAQEEPLLVFIKDKRSSVQ